MIEVSFRRAIPILEIINDTLLKVRPNVAGLFQLIIYNQQNIKKLKPDKWFLADNDPPAEIPSQKIKSKRLLRDKTYLL